MKIILSGASGTGKTTVLNLFKNAGYDVVTEVVRNLVKTKGIDINESASEESQMMIFDGVMDSISNGDFVADRGPADVLGYTTVGVANGKINPQIFIDQANKALEWAQKHEDVVYVFFPIEFAVEADGVRSVDENYRSQTSVAIESWIALLSNNNYLRVSGSPEERYEQIIRYAAL